MKFSDGRKFIGGKNKVKLREIFRKFKSKKGFTGADVAVAISIIILTIGVVTAIYINTTNKSKDSIRYSNATRIATQLIENIQSMTYDELVYSCSNNLNSVNADIDGRIFGVNIPVGYSAEVLAPKITSSNLDVIRDVTVNVTYTISNTSQTITLYTKKEKELLEQTNEPNLNMISDYSDSDYYAIKYEAGNYIVTATSDSDWYNYDKGYYALLLKTSTKYNYGDTVMATDMATGLYVWVPRFGLDSSSNLQYCYGTSNYQITFSIYDNLLYGYMLIGNGSGENYTVAQINSYIENTFDENDGLTGVWYQPYSSENSTLATSIYEEFNNLNSINNL